MLKHRWLWLAGFLLIIVLAACGGTVAPATPAPVNQNFQTSATGGKVFFYYPTGWIAKVVNGQIVLANSQAALDAPSPASGQFVARMVIGPISAIGGLAPESTSREVITFFANSLATTGIKFSDPTDLTIAAYTASRVSGSSSDGDGNITAVNLGNGVYDIVSAVSASGEMNQFDPTLRSILATVTYAASTSESSQPQVAPVATSEAHG